MEKVTIKGLDINYERKGEGTPLLVLHGWGASSESWQKVQENLSGFELIIPDLPGFGESDDPPEPWTIKDYLNFIQVFIEKLNLDEFYLVGHSFGGSLAVKFAITAPDKVKKIILIDSAGIKPKPKLMVRALKFMARKGKGLASLLVGPLSHFKESSKELFYKLIENTDYGSSNEVMKETMKNIFDYYTKTDNKELSSEQRGKFISDLEKVKNQTLLIWGEEDKIIPLEYGKVFNKKINNSTLKIISDVGHSPHLKSPLKLVQIIDDYLST